MMPSWRTLLVSILVVSAFLTLVPWRSSIAPLVESDYCYQLIAVQRAVDGHGFTSLKPVAPRQPWEPQYDFAFLTQWPVGYPLLLWIVRVVFGIDSLAACRWIGLVASAAALVGWFTWIRASVPRGIGGYLLAGLGAATAVSVPMLVNPSTDIILIGGVPFVLILSAAALHQRADNTSRIPLLLAAGLLAGALCGIRYAAFFLPIGVGSYLVYSMYRRPMLSRVGVFAFALAALAPIAALLIVNRQFGSTQTWQGQMNLGSSIGFAPSIASLANAWLKLTDIGLLSAVPASSGFWAALPPAVWLAVLCVPRFRRRASDLWRSPQFALSAFTVVALLVMLLATSTLFAGKYNYVGLARYYEPVRPLYFVLFLGPLLLLERPISFVPMLAGLAVCCGWTLTREWYVPYHRAATTLRETTPLGQRAVAFSPGAADLYDFLRTQATDNLILFSNFHEYITLETNLPAAPLPPSPQRLKEWVSTIANYRGMTNPRVLLAIDPDNHWRSYFLPSFDEVVAGLGLQDSAAVTVGSARVFEISVETPPHPVTPDP